MATPTPGRMITAIIHKEYGQSGGLTIRQFGEKLMITSVEKDSKAAEAGLKRGFLILSMNNVESDTLSEDSAQELLEGDERIILLCQEPQLPPNTPVTAVLHKETKDTSVGLSLKAANGEVVVSSVKPGSPADVMTDLKPGMLVKSINNFDCVGLSTKQACYLVSEAVGQLNILACTAPTGVSGPTEADHVVAAVTLKDGSAMGLELVNGYSPVDGSPIVIVKSIAADGPFFGTSIRVGMQVLKVQNVDCSGASAEQIATLVADGAATEPTLMLLAQKTQSRAPGSLMTVVVNKEDATSKLGISMYVKEGRLHVGAIRDGTLGSTTELETGMVIHTINNAPFVGKTAVEDAAKFLTEAQGEITFLVQMPGRSVDYDAKRMVVATMHKDQPDIKVGMGLAFKEESGLSISKLAKGGLAADSELKVGYKVLLINNVACASKKMSEVSALLAGTNGLLTVVAEKPEYVMSPGTYVAASIKIPQAEGEDKPKVGIKFRAAEDSSFIITEISEGGLAFGTDLRVGMLLLSINNEDCASKKTVPGVAKLFKQETDVLNILAKVPGTSNVPLEDIITSAVDSDKDGVEGGFEYTDDGRIVVTDTGAKGLLKGSALRSGMEVMSINNHEAGVLSRAGLEQLLQTEERLVLVAKKSALPKDMLLTEVIKKESIHDKVGLGLRSVGKKIIISNIKDNSLASSTRLMPGMEIVSIDNEDCLGATVPVVGRVLKNAIGNITIVASSKELEADVSYVTATMEKTEEEQPVGITIVRKLDGLFISKISDDGLAADTDLAAGMELISINNHDVNGMAQADATKLLTSAKGTVTILAKRPTLKPGAYVTAFITKETPETSLGIKLGVTKTGEPMIKGVKPFSPAAYTQLEGGMLIKSINNVDTSKMPGKEVAALLTTDAPVVTILAQTTAAVSVGRASFTSMRSVNGSSLSLCDTLGSTVSGQGEPETKKDKEIDIDEIEEMASTDDDETPVPESDEAPMVNMTPSDISAAEETLTLVQQGQRISFTVTNVVDC